MPYRILFLALVLLTVSALLAGAATLPASPAPAPSVTTAALPWLQPAANSTPVKPGKAPLGAIFKSGCSNACLQDEFACYDACGGDHDCNVNCNNDYYCCLQSCDPNLPQCN